MGRNPTIPSGDTKSGSHSAMIHGHSDPLMKSPSRSYTQNSNNLNTPLFNNKVIVLNCLFHMFIQSNINLRLNKIYATIVQAGCFKKHFREFESKNPHPSNKRERCIVYNISFRIYFPT